MGVTPQQQPRATDAARATDAEGSATEADGGEGPGGNIEGPGGNIARRIATYLPSSVIPAVLTLLTSVIFTRIFNPAAFGEYSLFLVVATPVKLVFTTWLTQGIGKFLPAADGPEGRARAKNAVAVSALAIVVAESALAVVIFGVFGLALSAGHRSLLGPVLLFVVASSVFEVLSQVFSMEGRAKEFVAYRLTDSIVTFALRLVLVSAFFRMGISLMFWSVVLSNGVLVPLMWRRAGLAGPVRVAALLSSPQVRRLARAFLAFGLPMTVWFFSGILLDVGDRYVLNYLLGSAAVGLYDANYRLMSGLAALMTSPITITLHPYLMSISSSGDIERIGKVIATIVERLLVVGTVCVGVAFLLHAELARVLLGPQFRPGSVIMPLVLAGVFLFNAGLFAHKPFEIVGRTRIMVTFGVISAVANVGLCFALIPWFGYVGAAYATVFAYALYLVAVGLLGRRVMPWRLDLRRLFTRIGIISAGVVAIDMLRHAVGPSHVWNAILTVLASGVLALFSLVAFVIGPSPLGRWRSRQPSHHAEEERL